jgi:hypothetical protein
MLAGQEAVGFCVSATITLKLQVLVLPTASVAVLVTVVVPTLNVDPLAGTAAKVTPAQLSVAPTVKVPTAPQVPVVAIKLRGVNGQVATGFSASVTVTLNVQLVDFAAASVEVPVTVVVPLLKLDPLAGLEEVVTPGQLSVPPIVNVGLA